MKTPTFRNKSIDELYRIVKPEATMPSPVANKEMEWKTIGYIALGVSGAALLLYCVVRLAVSQGNSTQLEAFKSLQLKPKEKVTDMDAEPVNTHEVSPPVQDIEEVKKIPSKTAKRKAKA